MIDFNPEIRMGDLLEIGSFIGLGVATFYNLRNRLNVQDMRLDNIDASIEDAKRDLKETSTVNWRLTSVENTLKELQHLKGFVLPDHRQ